MDFSYYSTANVGIMSSNERLLLSINSFYIGIEKKEENSGKQDACGLQIEKAEECSFRLGNPMEKSE